MSGAVSTPDPVDHGGKPLARGNYVRIIRGRIARVRRLVFLPGNTTPTWRVELTDGTTVMSHSVTVIEKPAP